MKKCKQCCLSEPEVSFRGNRSLCKSCESKQQGVRYRKNVKKNPELRTKYAAEEKERRRTPHHIRHSLFRRAKHRAKQMGFEFSIAVDDIVLPTHCPILGIPLQIGDGGISDNSPSLDRTDSSKGYIRGNVEVISYRANTLKNNASSQEIQKVYEYLVKRGL